MRSRYYLNKFNKHGDCMHSVGYTNKKICLRDFDSMAKDLKTWEWLRVYDSKEQKSVCQAELQVKLVGKLVVDEY